MLSFREVQHIAKLARIGLSEGELMKFQKDLGSILEYFEILREVNPVSTYAHEASLPLALSYVSREDVAPITTSSGSKRLLEMAPETKNGYLKVKSIL